ncbi:hypothetical protein PGT21_018237 [Puccinia graminis f. sp. tritici]|uniref:Uncharacterized protein n=1 Tax=Puccinia graminis f. sp. tritici TaxID=56615 RepID=A0A5B0LWM2_PUCGR|nr:hypothetical protein PGT21_018237 [Puccinia graminis f. sp. tritici]
MDLLKGLPLPQNNNQGWLIPTRLEAIKNAIMKNPKPLRDIINHIEFNELVDQVNNAILAQVDQMNNAPNGVNKNHPDQYTGGVPVAI